MSRIVAAMAAAAALCACQASPRPDPAVQRQVQELRDRILVLRTRLALQRSRAKAAAHSQPQPGSHPPPARSNVEPRDAEPTNDGIRARDSIARSTPVPQPATAPQRTPGLLGLTLTIETSEVPELEGGAAWLANVPRTTARGIIRDNWRRTTERAQTIRLLVHMRRTAAEEILSGMSRRVLWFDQQPDRVRVYEPDHPQADADGTIAIRLVRTTAAGRSNRP